MHKKYVIIPCLFIVLSIQSGFDIKSAFNDFGDSIKKTANKVGDAFKKAGDTLAEGFTKSTKDMFLKKPEQTFCKVDPSRTYAPTVDDKTVIEQDSEGMIPTIKKYAPVLYLCNETYLPCAAEDCFTVPGTQLVYQPDHKKKPSATKTVVISRGKVTMEGIYEHRTKYSGSDFFFEIDKCTEFGSNPARFSDKNGNLTTPIYVTWNEHEGKIYIVYAFLYAYNGAYPLSVPLIDAPLVTGEKLDIQGAHEFDVEHITLELNANKELERIHYATHSSKEGVWYAAKDPDVSYEGTHPIVHVAHNGHGSYPREGTHVRIFGFGNDITCKTKKWIPQLVLLYPDNDPRFNPKTMGWAYHSGDYGPRGVGSLQRFFGGHKDVPKGRSKNKVPFCKNPRDLNSASDVMKYRMCIEGKRKDATIP